MTKRRESKKSASAVEHQAAFNFDPPEKGPEALTVAPDAVGGAEQNSAVPGQPACLLRAELQKDTSEKVQLPFAQWPEVDRRLWEAANGTFELLDIDAPTKWRPATEATVRKGYGRFLTWLRHRGRLDHTLLPVQRASEIMVREYLADLIGKAAPYTAAGYAQTLAMALERMERRIDIQWLWTIVNNLTRQAGPVRDKRERIVPVQDLYRHGFDLMNRPSTEDPVWDVVRFRDGLMVALLAARPVRLRNLQMIQIGKHLKKADGRYLLHFEPSEVKTKVTLTTPLPAALTEPIDLYLSHHRPVLAAQADANDTFGAARSAFWLTRFGTAMAEGSMSKRIKEVTAAHFGHAINPHLFRDCAATSIALDDPEHTHVAMHVLGHSNPRTADRYYTHVRARQAAAIHDRTITELRRQFRREDSIKLRMQRKQGDI